MEKTLRRKILPVFAIGFLGILTVVILLFIELYSVPTSLEFSEPVRVTIPRGASLSTIAHTLHDANLIEEAWKFEASARIFRLDRKIRAGRYRFTKPMSPIELAKALTSGGYFDIMATFPEGSTIFDIARIARDSLSVDSSAFVDACFDTNIINKYGIDAPSLEGYLFPETYSLPEGVTAEIVIDRMVRHFLSKWDPLMTQRAEKLGMTREEIVTLASIVEAEATVNWEQGVVASVFHNRLRRGMLLQADPTVIYGLRSFGRPLTRADLDTSSSPYNTYRFGGLPPGPICNPGLDAIFATLWPDSTDYFFFVSNEDGTHWFTRELSEHYNAIDAIRRRGESGPLPEVIIDNRKVIKEISNSKTTTLTQ